MSDTNSTSQQWAQKFIDQRGEKELRFIIIGKSGNGKSSFGNSLCGFRIFQTSSATSSCTKECRVCYREFEGNTLIICDTPGLFDTNTNLKDIKKEICRPLGSMVSPGPHAFLIVLSAAHRFTEEEQKAIEYINDMFGSDAGKYCILIITREDEILDDDKTVDQYLKEADEPLKRLVAQCQNRYLAINNRADQAERDEKVRQLIRIVRNMLKENKNPYYTNKMFAQAEKEFEEKEIEALNSMKAQTEAQIGNLREELQREIQENLQRRFPEAAYQVRNMQRDDVNNQRPTTLQTVLSFAGQIAESLMNAHIADVQSRPAIAAIETQAARDERRDMIIYESMRLPQRAIKRNDSAFGYIVQGSGETDSDSNSD